MGLLPKLIISGSFPSAHLSPHLYPGSNSRNSELIAMLYNSVKIRTEYDRRNNHSLWWCNGMILKAVPTIECSRQGRCEMFDNDWVHIRETGPYIPEQYRNVEKGSVRILIHRFL
ncbi:hypothetical protein EYC80_007537 [Monilinia laxa]|uniref:Uncharacterized protein n=1 Tax=Monilinia laxa TaxID=61186 RepID=A0A5N6JW93_MONLA|nr:hypothetical protein EYC80_007537 [Monilinia laxa]